jgi:hypothetical protein
MHKNSPVDSSVADRKGSLCLPFPLRGCPRLRLAVSPNAINIRKCLCSSEVIEVEVKFLCTCRRSGGRGFGVKGRAPLFINLGTRWDIVNLTFRGPCIVMYSYNESQRDALFLKLI